MFFEVTLPKCAEIIDIELLYIYIIIKFSPEFVKLVCLIFRAGEAKACHGKEKVVDLHTQWSHHEYVSIRFLLVDHKCCSS